MVRAFLLVCRRLFSWCPCMAERRRVSKPSAVSSPKGTNPITRAPSSWPHLNLITLKRLHLKHTITWGVRTSTYGFGEETNKQTNICSFHLQIHSTSHVIFSLLVEILKPLLVPKYCHVGVMKKKTKQENTYPQYSSFPLYKNFTTCISSKSHSVLLFWYNELNLLYHGIFILKIHFNKCPWREQ